MRVCVLNGSPKGKYSITLQTVLYLQKYFSKHEFEVIDVGQKIRAYEKDFTKVAASIQKADLLLFAYPVYTFIAPSQLHRFISLLKVSGMDLSGKYMTQITTSKHFYDMTAHKYIEENAQDLGLRVIHGLSADMDDLLNKKGQVEAKKFFQYVSYCVAKGIYEVAPPRSEKVLPDYVPRRMAAELKTGKHTVIVTDCVPEDSRLQAMIEDFKAVYPYPTRIVNIAEYPFSGGCLGCFNCAGVGTCIYKDWFDTFLR